MQPFFDVWTRTNPAGKSMKILDGIKRNCRSLLTCSDPRTRTVYAQSGYCTSNFFCTTPESYNSDHAARAGVERPTSLSWLGLFPMCVGLQPFRAAYRRGY